MYMEDNVRPRFFDQVGHETMYASSGKKHFFTNLVIVRIMNRADRNEEQFQEIKYLISIKVGLLVKYSSQNYFSRKIQPILSTEK